MAKKDNAHPILQLIKSEAKKLQASAKYEGKILVYGHALDQTSKQHGYKDWNTACGTVNNATATTSDEKSLSDVVEGAYRKMRGNYNTLSGTQSLNDFFPTSSVADLRNLSEVEKEAIKSSFTTKVYLGRDGDAASFDFSTNNTKTFLIAPSGAGMSYYIEALIFQAREESPSFSEEEATKFVYSKYHIQTVKDRGESMSNEEFKRLFFKTLRKYGGDPIQKANHLFAHRTTNTQKRNSVLAAIKALFRATPATPPPPSLVFDGSISVPRIGCFCSDDVSELLNIVLVSPGVPLKYPLDAYQSFVKSSPPSWGTFDFLRIDSIGASWSDDKYFSTIEVFGEDTYDAMNTYRGWGIMECKAHIDTDLFRSTTQIKRVRWNNRVEITNDGGSHHFAVLRHHIASGQNYSFSTTVDIDIFERYIDEDLARAAMDKYHFFIISIGTYANLHRTYASNVDFMVAERKHRYGKSIGREDQNDRIVAVPLEHTKEKNHRAQLLDDLIRASQSSPEMCLDFNHYILCRI